MADTSAPGPGLTKLTQPAFAKVLYKSNPLQIGLVCSMQTQRGSGLHGLPPLDGLALGYNIVGSFRSLATHFGTLPGFLCSWSAALLLSANTVSMVLEHVESFCGSQDVALCHFE